MSVSTATASASYISSYSGGANFRLVPTAAPWKWLPNGASLEMNCWQGGPLVLGNFWSAKWFFVDTFYYAGWGHPTFGWVHSSLVPVAAQTIVPECWGTPVGYQG